ncbi:gelsolin-related protein of 125 kDa-like [Halyomorpha halys]|uniref:gelsolin-related protein of 125 kDa-like n=1 Tax=Halyomorpha halys TaxID=286706 RepID=UPI0034D34508
MTPSTEEDPNDRKIREPEEELKQFSNTDHFLNPEIGSLGIIEPKNYKLSDSTIKIEPIVNQKTKPNIILEKNCPTKRSIPEKTNLDIISDKEFKNDIFEPDTEVIERVKVNVNNFDLDKEVKNKNMKEKSYEEIFVRPQAVAETLKVSKGVIAKLNKIIISKMGVNVLKNKKLEIGIVSKSAIREEDKYEKLLIKKENKFSLGEINEKLEEEGEKKLNELILKEEELISNEGFSDLEEYLYHTESDRLFGLPELTNGRLMNEEKTESMNNDFSNAKLVENSKPLTSEDIDHSVANCLN